MYHLLLTQFWPNLKVRFVWPTMITTTKTTTTTTTSTTTFLGCDSIELSLVQDYFRTSSRLIANYFKTTSGLFWIIILVKDFIMTTAELLHDYSMTTLKLYQHITSSLKKIIIHNCMEKKLSCHEIIANKYVPPWKGPHQTWKKVRARGHCPRKFWRIGEIFWLWKIMHLYFQKKTYFLWTCLMKHLIFGIFIDYEWWFPQ